MTVKQWLIFGGSVYVLVIVAVVLVLLDARRQAVYLYAAPEEQSHWEEFGDAMDQRHRQRETLREEISQHSGQPVEAAPAKTRSERPPTLELLEKHFAACLAVSLAGVTLLFALMWGLLMGAMLRPGRLPEDSLEGDSRASAAN